MTDETPNEKLHTDLIFPDQTRPYFHLARIRGILLEQMVMDEMRIGLRLWSRGARLTGTASDLIQAKLILSDEYEFVWSWS